MTGKLLPSCPFCGSESEIDIFGRFFDTTTVKCRIKCSNENCIAHFIIKYYDSREEAAIAWGRRPKYQNRLKDEPAVVYQDGDENEHNVFYTL